MDGVVEIGTLTANGRRAVMDDTGTKQNYSIEHDLEINPQSCIKFSGLGFAVRRWSRKQDIPKQVTYCHIRKASRDHNPPSF